MQRPQAQDRLNLVPHLEVNSAPSDPEYERYRRPAADQYRNVIRSYPRSPEAEAARAGLRRLGFPD